MAIREEATRKVEVHGIHKKRRYSTAALVLYARVVLCMTGVLSVKSREAECTLSRASTSVVRLGRDNAT